MRKWIAILFAAVLVGCSTTKPVPPSVPVLVQSVSRTAVAVDLMDNPEHRGDFEKVVAVLDAFISGGDLDPATLRALLGDVDPKVFLAVLVGVDIYDAYVKDLIEKQLNDREHLLPVLISLRAGIQQGIDISQ